MPVDSTRRPRQRRADLSPRPGQSLRLPRRRRHEDRGIRRDPEERRSSAAAARSPRTRSSARALTIEDEVFIGHGVMFVNDRYPRATNRGRLAADGVGLERPADQGMPRRVDRQQRDDPGEPDHRGGRAGRRGGGRDSRRPRLRRRRGRAGARRGLYAALIAARRRAASSAAANPSRQSSPRGGRCKTGYPGRRRPYRRSSGTAAVEDDDVRRWTIHRSPVISGGQASVVVVGGRGTAREDRREAR